MCKDDPSSHTTKTAKRKKVVLPSITSSKCQCDALPIHHLTFTGLRWRLRAVYSWASPLLSGFRPKIFQVPPKSVQKWRFFAKMGLYNLIFIFKKMHTHILAWDRVFWRFLREDQFWSLGCIASLKNQKRTFLELYFTHMGRKNPWSYMHKILHW